MDPAGARGHHGARPGRRSETGEDGCLLDALQAYVAEGDFAGLVETLVRSEEFRYRPLDDA